MGGACRYAQKKVFGTMTSEGWARAFWGTATGAAVVMLVLAIASFLQLIPFLTPFITPWVRTCGRCHGLVPYSTDSLLQLRWLHAGALGVFIQGACLTGFARLGRGCY